MFLDNFDTNDAKDIERLFEYINKDKFNSLSFDEQEELLDFYIDCMSGKKCGSNKIAAIGLLQKNAEKVSMKEILEHVGRDKLKEALRDSIDNNEMYVSKIPINDVKSAVDKLKNGEADEEDIELIKSIVETFNSKKRSDVDFTTFAIMKAYCTYFNFEDQDGETQFIKDIEPMIRATYFMAMAGVLSNSNSPIGKMFNKHGYLKVQTDLIDLTGKLSDIIIHYSQENNITPEKTFLALLNVLKVMSCPLHISLDNFNEEDIEDMLFRIMFTESEKNYDDIDDIIKNAERDTEDENDEDIKDIKEISKDIENDSDKHLANANQKKSNNKIDVRKLLLDD